MEPTFEPARVPWGTQPGLRAAAREAGADFDRLMAGLGAGLNDMELSSELGVDPAAVKALRERFERYGIGSIVGQD